MSDQERFHWAVIRLYVLAFYIPIAKPLIRLMERMTGND